MEALSQRATSAPAPGNELPALTGARFFAALAVVVYHYGREAIPGALPWLRSLAASGPLAVSFFYVLSGAVVTWSGVDRAGRPKRSAGAFWVARAARVLPAYWLALAAICVPFAGHALRTDGLDEALPKIAGGVVANLLLVQAYLPPVAIGLNSPGWSVSCEAFFYAVWPRLVARLTPRSAGFPWRHVAAAWGLSLLGPLVAGGLLLGELAPDSPAAYWTLGARCSAAELVVRAASYFPPLRVFEFALGIALGHALRATPAPARTHAADSARELGLAALLTGLAYAAGSGLFGLLAGRPMLERLLVEGPLLAPVFAALVWQLARGRGVLVKALARPGLRRLGDASYGLYILQEPVLVWLSGTLKRVAPGLLAAPEPFFGVYVALLVAASLLAHRFVEVRGRAWLARRLGQPALAAQPRT